MKWSTGHSRQDNRDILPALDQHHHRNTVYALDSQNRQQCMFLAVLNNLYAIFFMWKKNIAYRRHLISQDMWIVAQIQKKSQIYTHKKVICLVSCVICHLSHVTCYLSLFTCHLPCLVYFLSYVINTASMLKPLEARNETYGTDRQTDTTTDIATYK